MKRVKQDVRVSDFKIGAHAELATKEDRWKEEHCEYPSGGGARGVVDETVEIGKNEARRGIDGVRSTSVARESCTRDV